MDTHKKSIGHFFKQPTRRISVSDLNFEYEQLRKLEDVVRDELKGIEAFSPEAGAKIICLIAILDRLRK